MGINNFPINHLFALAEYMECKKRGNWQKHSYAHTTTLQSAILLAYERERQIHAGSFGCCLLLLFPFRMQQGTHDNSNNFINRDRSLLGFAVEADLLAGWLLIYFQG